MVYSSYPLHWVDGGETSMSNLVLLCRRHHRLVHGGGFGVHSGPGGHIGFCYPGGNALPDSADGGFRGNVVPLRAGNGRSGLRITTRTLPPDWNGERMDANLAQLAMQSRKYLAAGRESAAFG